MVLCSFFHYDGFELKLKRNGNVSVPPKVLTLPSNNFTSKPPSIESSLDNIEVIISKEHCDNLIVEDEATTKSPNGMEP